jgi:peroxiredoxin
MIELGQLESHHRDFAARRTRIVAVSLDNQEDTAKTAKRFPHLVIVSDEQANLSGAVEVIGPHHAPDGSLTLSPTTILIDRHGQVRGVFRPNRTVERLTPEEVLARVDECLVRPSR